MLIYKGIKKFFRKIEICAKIVAFLFENSYRPKTPDTRLKTEKKYKRQREKGFWGKMGWFLS